MKSDDETGNNAKAYKPIKKIKNHLQLLFSQIGSYLWRKGDKWGEVAALKNQYLKFQINQIS